MVEPARILQIGRERGLSSLLHQAANIDDVTADLSTADAQLRFGRTRLDVADAAFDGIICLHRLERVLDDRAALRELRRVIKPGGWALLGVPAETALTATFEDPGVLDPADRARLFGRADKLRVYSRDDFLVRLRDAGWSVECRAGEGMSEADVRRYSLYTDPQGDLVLFCRPTEPVGAAEPTAVDRPPSVDESARALGISIVMPAYNEATNIETAISAALRAADRCALEAEVIVVNDGSTDGTDSIVAKLATIDPRIRLHGWSHNRGYGNAVSAGLRAASKDLVLFTDADNQFDLDELESLLPALARPEIGVVSGYRKVRRDPFIRKANAWGWNALVRLLFYVPVRDIDCAFKLFRRDVLQDLDIDSVGAMVNTELMVKLGRSGVGVVEMPVSHFPRTSGQARGANLRVIVRAFRELSLMRRRLAAADAATPVIRVASKGSR